MLSRKGVEQTIISLKQQQGITLDDQDLLNIRTSVALMLDAKKRHRQRMNAPAYQWKKPALRR
ncbi:hypothetical protein LU604_03515 [Erwinia tracheiphila]|uniref:Uncharacterized protein n=1 Tax=Erwinia tracheiphila TaxID=65700 RepID=A0A345CUP7_9GAMM|nr:hypothetical protein [Erwinia tracheiphila]AXF77164.1 hypothetical protein AV903_15840 [Erwinia tracheiphila]UIA84147.1 hypothetical protein LU604_03515 [Erwinia tracheiphila]UIA92729.1 hypothetical protein LU632_03475 [Erwinia tracheiphila]